jgi:outer membrane protein OmpA-like peptidoglycan-associated protein
MNLSEAGVCRTRLVALCAALLVGAGGALAQESNRSGLDREQYIPSIWVDPDGCEHWVMDDGIEGYMTPHVTRDGIPVCRTGNLCAIAPGALFETGSAAIGAEARGQLSDFFRRSNASAFTINGHTDNVASDASNLTLSRARAQAVAAIARDAGARVQSVQGFGERHPAASNATEEGRARNRRVEIICIN